MPRWYRPRPEAGAGRRASAIRHEEGALLGKVDRHRLADFAQQLGRDFVQTSFACPIFDALDNDAAHERRDPLEPRPCRGRPRERRSELLSVRDLVLRLDDGGTCGLVDAGGVGGEDVALVGKRAGATAAAQLLVLAAAAFAAQRPFPQLPEQRRAAPDLAEALRAEVAGHLGQIGTGREFAVGSNAAVLRPAVTACFVIQD